MLEKQNILQPPAVVESIEENVAGISTVRDWVTKWDGFVSYEIAPMLGGRDQFGNERAPIDVRNKKVELDPAKYEFKGDIDALQGEMDRRWKLVEAEKSYFEQTHAGHFEAINGVQEENMNYLQVTRRTLWHSIKAWTKTAAVLLRAWLH